jgi:hypothetical protein
MAWTIPKTWTAGETVTSSMMNTHIRDNLNVLKTNIADDGTIIAPRTLSSQSGAVNNVGAGETTLFTYTVPAGQLSANGQRLKLIATGVHAATANTKLFKLYFGAAVVAMLANAFNSAAGNWWFEAVVTRVGATSQTMWSAFKEWQTASANVASYDPRVNGTETLSGTVVAKITGQSASDGHLTGTEFAVEFWP